MLGKRQGHWAYIKTTICQCIVCAVALLLREIHDAIYNCRQPHANFPANTKHLHSTCTASAQHCTNVIQMLYVCWKSMASIRYASGVHFGNILENTALVQGIRCEPLGEHLIPWTCAVFFLYRTKMNTVCIFSHDCLKLSMGQISVKLTDMTRRPGIQHAYNMCIGAYM